MMKRKGILQLLEQYKADSREQKVNLVVGIYMDKTGNSPIFNVVKKVEENLISSEITKAKFNMLGSCEYQDSVKKLLFTNLEEKELDNILTVQTLGASGALSITANIIANKYPEASLWLSNPTWENHPAIFENHISSIKEYQFKPKDGVLDIDTIISDLSAAKAGDVVLFQGCCHNPTGIVITTDQWNKLASLCSERHLLPIIDFAYQGLEVDLVLDTEVLNIFNGYGIDYIVCNSFSKNMGLYDERIGALSLVFNDSKLTQEWELAIRNIVRTTYSLPPVHGSLVVTEVLSNPEFNSAWRQELDELRDYIDYRRNLVFNKMKELGITDKYLNYTQQKGMFICLQLSLEHVDLLREEYGIYIIDSGRVSIASLDETKVNYLCESLAATAYMIES
ncbi:aromatic amino acid transaminase [Mollicutes bacterium LVI A0039]|nr:aromatic amino acid transaminase [Mollicutes bacterium LVI A0039]